MPAANGPHFTPREIRPLRRSGPRYAHALPLCLINQDPEPAAVIITIIVLILQIKVRDFFSSFPAGMSDPNPHGPQMYGYDAAPAANMNGGDDKMVGVPAADLPPEQDNQIVECSNPNQLTLLFQGEVYVFESVTPEKVPPFFT